MKTQASMHIHEVWSGSLYITYKTMLVQLAQQCSIALDLLLAYYYYYITIGPRGYKKFSCSTQLSMKFSLQINMKMPTIVGIFIFIGREIFMLSYV